MRGSGNRRSAGPRPLRQHGYPHARRRPHRRGPASKPRTSPPDRHSRLCRPVAFADSARPPLAISVPGLHRTGIGRHDERLFLTFKEARHATAGRGVGAQHPMPRSPFVAAQQPQISRNCAGESGILGISSSVAGASCSASSRASSSSLKPIKLTLKFSCCRAARRRPMPARMPALVSTRIGLVKPNARMLAAIWVNLSVRMCPGVASKWYELVVQPELDMLYHRVQGHGDFPRTIR